MKTSRVIGLGLIIVVIFSIVGFITRKPEKELILFDEERFVGLGKKFNVIIDEAEIRDYTILDIEKFNVLFEDEKGKLREYMKENDLEIVAGEYQIHQAHRVEVLIEILEFE